MITKKRLIKKLLIIIFGIFMLMPSTVNASLENEWKYDIDLSNSVSSSIVKLEDGIAVMNYEGTASNNNTIIKLSYDGKLINSIKNDYGYGMSAFEGGLLINETSKITRLDKDLNIVWSVDATSPGNQFIDLNEGFAGLGDSSGNTLTVYDDNGNAIDSKYLPSYFSSLFGSKFESLAINKSLDGENIIILGGYTSGIGIVVMSRQFEVLESYNVDLNGLSAYTAYKFNGITETDDSYFWI